eukprot:scaffold113829_cov30-Tisochrysis_lutea.AAC.1
MLLQLRAGSVGAAAIVSAPRQQGKSGTVWTWGDGSLGSHPSPITGGSLKDAFVHEVSCGNRCFAAIDESGHVHVWGALSVGSGRSLRRGGFAGSCPRPISAAPLSLSTSAAPLSRPSSATPPLALSHPMRLALNVLSPGSSAALTAAQGSREVGGQLSQSNSSCASLRIRHGTDDSDLFAIRLCWSGRRLLVVARSKDFGSTLLHEMGGEASDKACGSHLLEWHEGHVAIIGGGRLRDLSASADVVVAITSSGALVQFNLSQASSAPTTLPLPSGAEVALLSGARAHFAALVAKDESLLTATRQRSCEACGVLDAVTSSHHLKRHGASPDLYHRARGEGGRSGSGPSGKTAASCVGNHGDLPCWLRPVSDASSPVSRKSAGRGRVSGY